MPEQLKRLAVLIDGEDISAKYADAIFDETAGLGIAIIRRFYGDISHVFQLVKVIDKFEIKMIWAQPHLRLKP
ncbi:hypothetical protein [Planktotalea arctica]|uniref:hypothetical protein n=1 Tax=Planktotalea arctica TaxID=1481893 RepID=UPI000A16F658|nr:hypothetical protein [Planktotalea arctica]